MNDGNPSVCILGNEGSIHIRRWIEGLRNLGLKVDLVTLNKTDNQDLKGISLNAGSKISYLTKVGRLRKIIKKLNPQILHAHYASSYGFLMSFIDHPQKILSVWGDDIVVFPNKNPLFKYIVRRSIDHAHVLTATSLFLKKTVSQLCAVHPPTLVIPFGVDLNHFKYVERPQRKKISIGFAKALKPKYGVDYLLYAFKAMVDANLNCELRIAGRGENMTEYIKLAKDLGISRFVRFEGFLNHYEIIKHFSEIDIFAMPSVSHGESFGVAAIEAAATGLPVVASNVGGVSEVVKDKITGFLIEPRNTQALCDALIELATNYEMRIKMGQAGRKFVEENCDWGKNLNTMAQLYRDLVY